MASTSFFLIINLWETESLDRLPASNLLYTPFQQSFKLKFSQHLLRRVHCFIFTFKFELIYYSKLGGNKLSNENRYCITGCSTLCREGATPSHLPPKRLLKIENRIATRTKTETIALFHRLLFSRFNFLAFTNFFRRLFNTSSSGQRLARRKEQDRAYTF